MNDDILEQISEAVHDEWMRNKKLKGVTSRPSESGEELMVPYAMLSEAAKDLDRGSVRATLEAIKKLGYKLELGYKLVEKHRDVR